jgi:threonine dehydrogenase-like Zn-dependent dehydrogenase
MLLLGLKAMGVSTVYMTEVMEYRRKKAEELGASLVWNPLAVKTAGRGVDVAIEAVGYRSDHKGLSVLGEASGKGHRSGHFHLAGVVAHARLRHPGGNHDRRQLHQSGIGSVLDSIRQYPPGEPDHRDYSPG